MAPRKPVTNSPIPIISTAQYRLALSSETVHKPASKTSMASNELARWPALIARVASFFIYFLKIFILTEEMYLIIYLPLVCSC
jgi:hypothetical protein